jgi:hypothetical protein
VGSVSRYDFFRIVLPGGLVVFLLDLCARLILATPRVRPSVIGAFPKFIEQPLVALAATFGIGLVLYFLDLPYSSPQFWKGIPSKVLESRMGADTKADPLSLFFLASDKLMPSEMRERALLYGAIYRIGFQLVLFTIIGCLVVPIGILFRLPDPPIVPGPMISGVTLAALAIVLPCILVPFLREAVKHTRRWPSWKFVLVIVLLVAGPCVIWLDLPYRYLPWSPQADY